MVRKLRATDFRARRVVLEPSDFALTDGEPKPAPTDLVDPRGWHGIMDIADDVAIRTTSHQGSRIGFLHELWDAWLEVMPTRCIVGYAMLDCSDDFAASILSLLHGFYRQAVGTLRSALETMVFACMCQLTADRKAWKEWEKGKQEINFVQSRHGLRKTSAVKALEDRAKVATGPDDVRGQEPPRSRRLGDLASQPPVQPYPRPRQLIQRASLEEQRPGLQRAGHENQLLQLPRDLHAVAAAGKDRPPLPRHASRGGHSVRLRQPQPLSSQAR